jgi:hypothetical protein
VGVRFFVVPMATKKKLVCLSLKYYLADSNGIISAFKKAPTTELKIFCNFSITAFSPFVKPLKGGI